MKSFLKHDANYEEVMKNLNSMELRRLLISHLRKITGNPPNNLLLSKEQILNTKECKTLMGKLYEFACNRDQGLELERLLDIGASVNGYLNNWGQPIHCVLYHKNTNQNMLHRLLKCPGIEINSKTIRDLNDTYGSGIRPILYSLNYGNFYNGVLLCAQGHDINEYDPGYWKFEGAFQYSDMGNIHKYNGGMHGYAFVGQVTCAIVKEMNTPNSNINKEALRKAYEYYKKIEIGRAHV